MNNVVNAPSRCKTEDAKPKETKSKQLTLRFQNVKLKETMDAKSAATYLINIGLFNKAISKNLNDKKHTEGPKFKLKHHNGPKSQSNKIPNKKVFTTEQKHLLNYAYLIYHVIKRNVDSIETTFHNILTEYSSVLKCEVLMNMPCIQNKGERDADLIINLHKYKETSEIYKVMKTYAQACKDYHGQTALSIAASTNWKDGIAELNRFISNIMAPDIDKKIPLHHAVSKKHREAVTFLMALGSKFNTKDINGITPYDLGDKELKKSMKQWTKTAIPTVKYFIRLMASAKPMGVIALFVSRREYTAPVKKWLNNPIGMGKYYPIHVATVCGYKDIVHILINYGAKENAITASGHTKEQLWAMSRYQPVHHLVTGNMDYAYKLLISKHFINLHEE